MTLEGFNNCQLGVLCESFIFTIIASYNKGALISSFLANN